MAQKHKVTVSVRPIDRLPSPAERRAALIASFSTKQADLKREAAESRARRANSGPPAGMPRKASAARRSNSR
jgi:hypothetical protein